MLCCSVILSSSCIPVSWQIHPHNITTQTHTTGARGQDTCHRLVWVSETASDLLSCSSYSLEKKIKECVDITIPKIIKKVIYSLIYLLA